MSDMRRRQFIALLGGAAAAWPLGARAQQANPLVGVLHGGSAAAFAPFMVAFRRGLEEGGFTEGQNVTIELVLRMLVPSAEVMGLLVNPRSPQGLGTNTEAEEQARDAQAAASAMRRQLILVRASSVSEIDEAFAAIVQQRAAALIVASDVFLSSRKDQLIALAARHGMPTIYPWRDAVIAGGLLSYGIDLSDSYRQVGGYIGRILKGAKPAELPVLQPTRFPLAINLRTATALGLTVPPTLLARADEVI